MSLKQRLASSRVPLAAAVICFALFIVATFIMPGRSGRLFNSTAWLGTATFGLMCLFAKKRITKLAGAGMAVTLCLLSIFNNNAAEVLLYLVASGGILYEGIPVLVFALVLLRVAPTSDDRENP